MKRSPDSLKEGRFAVDQAGNGKDGLSMALVENYDIIVLDVLLPVMSGF